MLAPTSAAGVPGGLRVGGAPGARVGLVLAGDNQGRVWKGSSEDCDVALGSHKVEAWVGDEVAPPRQAPDSGGMR